MLPNHKSVYLKNGVLFGGALPSLSELGDDITPCQIADTRTLLIANHQSTADVPLLMACFSAKPDVLPNIMWIMDRVFKFTNFGVVSVLHQDFFVRAVSSEIPKQKTTTTTKKNGHKIIFPIIRFTGQKAT